MKTDFFQSCGHCWVFRICWHIKCSTLTASCFRILNSSAGIPSPPLAVFVVVLPKAHLTSHSRLSGSRWVTTPSWLSWSLRPFCVVLCTVPASFESLLPLLVLTVSVLYHAHPGMKCSLDIFSFLEEISRLSHSIVFLYFFALFIEEGLISLCYQIPLLSCFKFIRIRVQKGLSIKRWLMLFSY